MWWPPKTEASYRTIPLPNAVLEALQQHLAVYDVAPDGLLFTVSGLPITRQAFGHQWCPAARAAGIPSGQGLHALRHASAAETLDTYSHLWPDSDDRTRDAVDAVLGAPADWRGLMPPVQVRGLWRVGRPVGRVLSLT